MSLLTWPFSYLPAAITRVFDWGVSPVQYDSGARQAMTHFSRPLYKYVVPFVNFNEVKQATLATFINSLKGATTPFLMKDPYDYYVGSAMAVRSGYISGQTSLSLFDTNSFFVRADTFSIGSLFSSLSGYVRLGQEYSYDQDTGMLTVNTKAVTDVWGARSMTYFRKCAFDGSYQEQSRLWNIFAADISINEIV